jgi:O-acetyl-ADP-ribose deacetylase (regulator of RNase III)
MITYTRGDMFEREFDYRVNPVNSVGVMGKGLAKIFREKYPEMFEDYKLFCKDPGFGSGGIHIWKSVINFATKTDWRQPSKIFLIAIGLRKLRTFLSTEENRGKSVAIPALGCGLGELTWPMIKDMIYIELKDIPDVDIYVFEPQ